MQVTVSVVIVAAICLVGSPARSFGVRDPLALEWRHLPEAWVGDDYETASYPGGSGPSTGIVHWSLKSTVPSTRRNYTIHVGSLSSGLPSTFSFQLPEGGCCHNAKVSATAKARHCTYATNAGFFDKKGCCVGNLVINSTIQMLGSTNRSNFGLTQSGYMLGYLSSTTIKNAKFLHMISGAGWLVRNGASYINTSKSKEGLSDKFVTEKAPRTAVVVHKNGTLSLMQVDGEEDISAGLDLLEFSEVLVQFEAWQAVNLDGGGSSVSVYKDMVISRPTCWDIPIICERAVSSIACMKES